ncbi:MAG: DUF2178 domain-containing protein [Ruminococcus sp.]|nr:DUF2178 domain-containing protein [Ruminococcus sp.]
MNIRSFFEAENNVKKPKIELHCYHKFAAAAFLMGAFTFLGIALINSKTFVVLAVLLALAAVIELVMTVRFFKMIKGHSIQQEDELARQIMYKASRMTAGVLILSGGIIELIFSLTNGSFTIDSSNVACLLFGIYLFAAGIKSLFFVLLDRVSDGEDE